MMREGAIPVGEAAVCLCRWALGGLEQRSQPSTGPPQQLARRWPLWRRGAAPGHLPRRVLCHTSQIYLFQRGLLSQDPDVAAAFQHRVPGHDAGRARGLMSVPNQHAATHDLRWPSYDKAFSGHSHSLRVALRSRLPVNYPLRRPTGRRRSFRVHAIPLRGEDECVRRGGCGGSSSPDPGQLHPATGAGQ
jgi:hypothetical protein